MAYLSAEGHILEGKQRFWDPVKARCIEMGFAGKISANRYDGSPDRGVRLLTIGLRLVLYRYIIIIRLLQTIVGDEIFS
jgi:hypothetical protein